MQHILPLVLFLLLFVVGGCKAAGWKKADRDSERQAAGLIVGPRKTAQADAGAAVGISFDLDEKNGRAKQLTILRLDYFPGNEKSGTNLPACYGSFAREFELGIVMCEGQPTTARQLTAGNLYQDCYTNPRFERVQPVAPIALAGCARGVMLLHAFDPTLRVDLEQRETTM